MRTEGRKPVLIVIAGPNGSGKTSVTSKILQHEWMEDSVYINPDIVAQEKFGDWNSMEAIKKAVVYCEEWREKCLVERKSLILKRFYLPKTKSTTLKGQKKQISSSGCFSSAQNHLPSMPHALPNG